VYINLIFVHFLSIAWSATRFIIIIGMLVEGANYTTLVSGVIIPLVDGNNEFLEISWGICCYPLGNTCNKECCNNKTQEVKKIVSIFFIH
jgi:hypothetical protein